MKKMRVLIVCSHRDYIKDGIAPFIKEQVSALQSMGIECEYYLVLGKGVWGYLQELPKLRKKIQEWKPDVIHAHYGLCGLLANIATRAIPVVTTYHGSDINNKKVFIFSKLSIWLSRWNIFVSKKNMVLAGNEEKKNASLIPCGIDDSVFFPMDKIECRKKLNMNPAIKYVLFTKKFSVEVKDYPLAQKTVDTLCKKNKDSREISLLEFDGFTRGQSVMLMNAVDALLLTSKAEGSPQVIKEAMACGCPIVSVDVGDVKERIEGVNGCYLAKSRDPEELALLLGMALMFNGKTQGPNALKKQNLSNKQVANNIVKVYSRIIER